LRALPQLTGRAEIGVMLPEIEVLRGKLMEASASAGLPECRNYLIAHDGGG